MLNAIITDKNISLVFKMFQLYLIERYLKKKFSSNMITKIQFKVDTIYSQQKEMFFLL